MSEKIVQLNEEIIKGQIKELVRGSVEETLNGLLEQEAQALTNAARYERSEDRQGYRSGHYERSLLTGSGEVKLKMPKLKGVAIETAIIERYPTLGGVCLNVGCIPSKALLHVASVIEEAGHVSSAGISFAAPQVDVDALRTHKEGVIGKLTGGYFPLVADPKLTGEMGRTPQINNLGGRDHWGRAWSMAMACSRPRAGISLARVRLCAVSSITPLGCCEPGSWRITPPSGSGVAVVMPASSSALLL